MAKKKVSSKKSEGQAALDCTYSPSVHLDFSDVSELEGLTVGDEVRVVIKGKVKAVEQREDWDDPKKTRASLSIKDFEATIVTDSNQFEELLDEEDD